MNQNIYNSQDVVNGLRKLQLQIGDIVFIHSSIKSLGVYDDHKFPNLLDVIKNTLFQIIGSNGTIVVPTFNFDFANGIDFDVEKTPSQAMGVFSEYIRNNSQSNRTYHPFHSISILGFNSRLISNLESNTEFSSGSAFDYLIKNNCKILYLGDCFTETFFHIAENNEEVPYRYWKKFSGNIIKNGKKKFIEIEYFARNLNLKPEPKIDLNKLKSFLDKKSIFNYTYINTCKIMTCSSKDYVNFCTTQLRKDPSYFLKIENN